MCIVVHMTCRISRFQDGGSLNNYITIFLAEGIWKVHIFGHLFVCFLTSVYTLGEFHKNRNNSTVFEELDASIEVFDRRKCSFTDAAFWTIKLHNCNLQLFKYSSYSLNDNQSFLYLYDLYSKHFVLSYTLYRYFNFYVLLEK